MGGGQGTWRQQVSVETYYACNANIREVSSRDGYVISKTKHAQVS
jgi:hypothetical protein